MEPATYTGYLRIDKSITILPNAEGGRYTVNGQVRIVPGVSERRITVSGMRNTSSVYIYGTATSRLDVEFADCFLSSATLEGPAVHATMLRDTIETYLNIYSGSIIGCVFGGVTWSGAILQVTQGSTLPDPLSIIGNHFRPTNNGANSPFIIDISIDKEFHVENNFVSNNTNTARFIRFYGGPAIGTPPSSVANNTFYRSVSVNQITILSQMGIVNVDIVNNAVIGDFGGPIIDWQYRSGLTSANLYAASSWINTSTGQPSIGSPLINAGDPDPRYLDLDLTTNDVGCYGGSNSRANFTTGMGSAVVGFMQAPRVVSQGDAVNISATGFDR